MRVLPLDERRIDVFDGRSVEHWRGHIHTGFAVFGIGLFVGVGAIVIPALSGGPAEMGLEDLPDVHAAWHAQRVEDHVDRSAVLEERHVLLIHDLRDDTLVAVTARELVALGDLALLGHEHPHQVVDPRRQVVALVTAEGHHVDHDATLTVGHLQRGVPAPRAPSP